ncbi:cyclin-D4-1-like isoform X2 [Malania oleifera]|uniref:cyclin-D4-1-like isoform X2 n=1 Tax=Malania oleifera TaxID=397392 RepID=UPI0025ADCEC6|nr:cyclin-D4-1-like isoform X2 [Malania oleifera]
MAASSDCSVSDLYCREAEEDDSDEVTAHSANRTHFPPPTSSDSPAVEDHSFLINLFDSERDHILCSDAVRKLREDTDLVAARRQAVRWMMNVCAIYKFIPETAYLSVQYMDRFLSSHSLPRGKEWPLQLLSVACLALAAKMEEASVPLLSDLQVIEPRFVFTPKTIQRMELLVMTKLKWRLRVVTPFDFVNYFIDKCPKPRSGSRFGHFSSIFSRTSDLILNSCRVIEFLDYAPSTMAAAAVLWTMGQNINHEEGMGCFCERVSRTAFD